MKLNEEVITGSVKVNTDYYSSYVNCYYKYNNIVIISLEVRPPVDVQANKEVFELPFKPLTAGTVEAQMINNDNGSGGTNTLYWTEDDTSVIATSKVVECDLCLNLIYICE